MLADEDLGSGTTGKQLNAVLIQLGDLLESNRETIQDVITNTDATLGVTVEHQRDLAELLDLAP